MHREALTGLAHQAHALRVRITREATGILDDLGHTLVRAHLVEHLALHMALDTNQTVVRTNHNHVVLLQTDITGQTAVQDILIDIHHGDQLATTIDLDVTQRTDIADTTSHIQGMEHSSKGTQRVSTGGLDLTHHIHHKRTGLTDRQLQAAAGITAAKRAANL